MSSSIFISHGIVYCGGQALLRFATSNQAAIYLMLHGYRLTEPTALRFQRDA